MLLALVRHALAAPPEGRGAEADAARPLTEEGRKRLKRVRKALREAELRFDRMLFSPRTRALETAEVLMPLVDGPAHAEPLLAVPPRDDLLAAIRGERPLLVGHQPYLGELAAWLVWGDRKLGAQLDVGKAGVLLLEGEPRPKAMQLKALLPPGILRRLARG